MKRRNRNVPVRINAALMNMTVTVRCAWRITGSVPIKTECVNQHQQAGRLV